MRGPALLFNDVVRSPFFSLHATLSSFLPLSDLNLLNHYFSRQKKKKNKRNMKISRLRQGKDGKASTLGPRATCCQVT